MQVACNPRCPVEAVRALVDAGIEEIDYFSFGLYPMVCPAFLKRLVMRGETLLLDAGWKHHLGVELWLRGRVRKTG